MPDPPRLGPKLLLAFLERVAWLVPVSRRREWRRQWRADIAYAWQRRSTSWRGAVRHDGALSFAAGAVRHAFWLRGHVRRIEMISHDLRYGWRLMLRRPGFTAVAVLTLGLGIGANVTIYSWVEALLVHPIRGAVAVDRLMALNATTHDRGDLSLSWPNFVDIRLARPGTVDDLLAYRVVALNVRTTGEPERIWGEIVSANYFDVLGVTPALGRGFLLAEDRTPGAAPVAVFSDTYWRNHLGSDPSIVGRTVTLNGRVFTVVGIAPPRFRGNATGLGLDVWVPMAMQTAVMPGDRLNERGSGWLQAMARLKPGVSLARAQADLDVIADNLSNAYTVNAGRGLRLYPLWRAPGTGGAIMLPILTVLGGVVGIVLLIACANVASLLLARATGRRRETAVRLALGASRGQLVQQLLTESLLLAVAGGAVGALIAYWTSGLLTAFFPPTATPLAVDASLSTPVVGFAALLTLGCAFVFGLVPALQNSRTSLASSLKESAGTVATTPNRARLRRVLVVAQVALSLILLVAAGLFLQTLRHARAYDLGFSLRQGLIASLDLLPAGYDESTGTAILRDVQADVRDVPGVEAATLTQTFPLSLGSTSDFNVRVDGYSPAANEEITVYYSRVGSNYLRTMGIQVIEGRDITDEDTKESPDIGVVNQTMARRYWTNRSPIGGRIRVGNRTVEVVGVAADGKYGTVTEPPRNYLYLPVQQWYRPDTMLVVRTAREPLGALAAIRRAVYRHDPNLPLFDVETIAEHLTLSLFLQRMAASLLGGFGIVALLLAMMGLYGVLASAVAERTSEIGMRMALGASRGDILALILRQGLTVTAGGLAIGLVGALAVAQLLESELVGVNAADPVSFAMTSALLVVVAVAATSLPARKAASIDPLEALRRD